MKFSEAVQEYLFEEVVETPTGKIIKIPKALKEIKKVKEGHDTIVTYSAPTKLKWKDRRNNKWYDFQLEYKTHHSWVAGNPGDPDAIDYFTWDKVYKVEVDGGYGMIAYSNFKKGDKFSEKGYKEWSIYLYYTQSGGRPMMQKHFKKDISTEDKALAGIYQALDSLATRISMSKDPQYDYDDMTIIGPAYEK